MPLTRWRALASHCASACVALSLAGCHVSIGVGFFDDEDALIDPGNAASAAATGFDTLVSLAGPVLGIADEPFRVPADETPRRALVPGTFDWLEWAAPIRGPGVPVSGGRFSSDQTRACDSGTVRVTAVFLNSTVFGAGDTIELDAADCRFGGLLFEGRLAMRVIDGSGYPGASAAWSTRVSVDYFDWHTGTIALPLQARTVNGRAVLDAQRLDAVDAAMDFDSPVLSIDPVVSGAVRARRAVEFLSLRLTVGVGNVRVSGDFELFDGRFAGTDLETLRVRSDGAIDLPVSPPALPLGILLVSAPDDAGVYARALDATQVRLALDRFLDGQIDATLLSTWSEMRGLL
ncbi:MAG: hypothetical protein EHM83_14735 [Burkholderiales bacterium]|nr:MAG: hypothetical protein EHM83_14735 [Burkholderiales bacterium]